MKPFEEDDFRKKREQFSCNIRRANRDQIMMKRRFEIQAASLQPQILGDDLPMNKQIKNPLIIDQSLHTFISELYMQTVELSQLKDFISIIKSSQVDIHQIHRLVIGVRKCTQKAAEFTANLMLQKQNEQAMKKLMVWYDQKEYPQIKLQLLWSITNMISASTPFTHKIAQKKNIILFCADMVHQIEQIKYHAIWTVGNIAAESPKLRDQVLQHGSIYRIMKFLEEKRSQSEIVTSVWALSNLSRGFPPPKYDTVKFVIAPIATVIKSNILKNQSVLSDCLWTLANLSDGGKLRVSRIAETHCLPKIISYLLHPMPSISIPAIRIVGNFTNGTKQHTNCVIESGFLDVSLEILEKGKPLLIKQTCWALSNIAAGTTQQTLRLLQRQDLVQKLLGIYNRQSDDCRAEIIWIFTNIEHCQQISEPIVNLYLSINLIGLIGQQLKSNVERCVTDSLLCLYKILTVAQRIKKVEEQPNILQLQFLKQGYQKVLQSLQVHQSEKIYKQVNILIERFFQVNGTMNDI